MVMDGTLGTMGEGGWGRDLKGGGAESERRGWGPRLLGVRELGAGAEEDRS